MDAKAWAHSLIADFRKRNKGGVWLNMNCNTVASELDARVDSPELISQNNTPFCGYAALAYTEASRYPQNYAWFAIALFEDGEGWFGAYGGKKARVRPSSSVRSSRLPMMPPPGSQQMPQADWMVLASLREHFNALLFDIGEGIPVLGLLVKALHGGATAGELADALKEIGATDVNDWTNVHSTVDFRWVTAADGHFAAGNWVFLRIDSDLLTPKHTQDPGFGSYGDHWVVLNSRIQLSPDKEWISFKCFSWGQIKDVPGPGMVMRVSQFLKFFYGFVVGKF